MVGIGLIIIGCVILGFALSQPKIAVPNLEENVSAAVSQTVQNTQQSNNSQNMYESYVEETASNVSSANDNETVNNNSGYSSSSNNSNGVKNSDDEVSVSYPLNLNTCTAEELMTISGIGEVKASDIIQYREYLGGYTSVEQIKNIKGIGDKIYEKISPYLTV